MIFCLVVACCVSPQEICDIIRQEYDTTTQQPSPGDGGQAAAMVASGG